DRAGVHDPEKRWIVTGYPMIDDAPQHIEHKVHRTLIHGGINHGRQIVHFKDHKLSMTVANVGLLAAPFGDGPLLVANTIRRPPIHYAALESPEMSLRKRREPITYFHERNGVAELFHKL